MNDTLAIKSEGISIFAKLLSGFFLILVLTGIGEYYSHTQILRLSELTTKIFNHPLRVTRAVLSADINIIKIHRSMKDVALSLTPAEIEAAIELVDAYEKEVYQHLGTAEQWILGEEGASLLAKTIQSFRDWKSIRDEVIDLTKAGERIKAFAITKGKGAKHVELLNRKMEDLKNYAAIKASGMLDDSQKTNEMVVHTTSIIFIGLVILCGLIGYSLSQAITGSIKQIVKGVEEFSDGNLDYRVKVISRDEIGWLAKAFNNMAKQRKKAFEELGLQSEIMANMAEGVYLVGAEDGIIVYANPKLEEMFGYGQGEMNGKPVSIVNAPAGKDPEQTAGEIMKELRETGTWQGEVNNIKKDGTPFWGSANVSVFDHHKYGKVLVSVHTDITKRKHLENELLQYNTKLEQSVKERTRELEKEISERKRVEEQIQASLTEKETLLLEIHHRVKNNMQVVSSLLKLQANVIKDDKTKKVLIESQNRVKAMATVHENLYKSKDLSSIIIDPFLKELTDSILVSYQSIPDEIKLKIESDEIYMSIEQATPLGLIINELVSNSLKYAFPDERRGRIEINVNQANNGIINLQFSDNGVGIPASLDWRNTDSLGLKLVLNLVENQLDGSIDMEIDDGTNFDITFKADRHNG